MPRFASIVICALLVSSAYLVYARFIDGPAHSDPSIPIPYSNKEGKPMLAELTSPTTRESASVALIDRDQPRHVETATFALG
ncbi:MAG TPA: hypothetical protein VKX17_04765 [Planctomycetota bacterium]|nr:hypothetical protein [Planctomycetota bacterium]